MIHFLKAPNLGFWKDYFTKYNQAIWARECSQVYSWWYLNQIDSIASKFLSKTVNLVLINEYKRNKPYHT